jgi:hypothetical protein
MSAGKGRQMKKSLEHWVAPAFREEGFLGKFPVLRRARGDQLDVVELQFVSQGGGFRMNLGVCPAQGIITKWGKYVPPDEVSTLYEMSRKYFLDPRNVTQGKSQEHWFKFDESNTDQVAKDFLPNVELADRWFLTGEAPTLKSKPHSQGGPIHRFVMRLLRPQCGPTKANK